MTVTDWPARSPPPDDGAALPPLAPALAPPLAAALGAAEVPPPLLAAGLDEAVPDEQAAASSVAPAMSAAILDRRLVRSSMPFLLSRITDPVVGSCSGAIGWRGPPGPRTSGESTGRRAAHDELGRKQRPVRVRSIGEPLHERQSGGLPELEGRQPDGGEGWVEVGGKRDVVETDDRHVVRNLEAGLAQRADRTER